MQELQRAFLRELRAQRAAAAVVHPAGDGVHLLLLPAAAAVRLHAHMRAATPTMCKSATGQNALSALGNAETQRGFWTGEPVQMGSFQNLSRAKVLVCGLKCHLSCSGL